MVVCAEEAKSCCDDDVTVEVEEKGGRPCNSVWKKERVPNSHNTHMRYSHNQNILKHTCMLTHAFLNVCVHTEMQHARSSLFLSLSFSLSL